MENSLTQGPLREPEGLGKSVDFVYVVRKGSGDGSSVCSRITNFIQ